MLLELLNKIFSKDTSSSKVIAKERLKLVLIHDRASISPELLESIKEEMINIIKEYLDIDEDSLLVSLENERESVALVANIPIRGLKKAN